MSNIQNHPEFLWTGVIATHTYIKYKSINYDTSGCDRPFKLLELGRLHMNLEVYIKLSTSGHGFVYHFYLFYTRNLYLFVLGE